MRISLKALGLALVAALAMSAFAASSASAGTLVGVFTSDSGSTTIQGKDSGANSLTMFGDTVSCPGSTYTGHDVLGHFETKDGKTHQPIPNGRTAITLTPHYKQIKDGTANCDLNHGEFSVTIAMNGCDYVLHDFTTTGNQDTYGLTIDFDCPSNQVMVMQVYSGHSHGFQVCTTTIPAQSGLSGLHATDTTDGTIHLNGTLTGVRASQSGLCGSAEEEGATYTVNMTIAGQDEFGEEEGVTISEETLEA